MCKIEITDGCTQASGNYKEEDYMRKFLATLLALAMALSLMVPAAWAEPADEPASATYEAVLGKTARKYGNIELDISTEEFMKAGLRMAT